MLRIRTFTKKGIDYSKAEIGDIFCSDKSFVSPDDYVASGKNAIGVVFSNESKQLKVMALDFGGFDKYSRWGEDGEIQGLSYVKAYNVVETQQTGKENTDLIIAALGEGDNIASKCRAYYTEGTSPGDWSLPSGYELNKIRNYSDLIQTNLGIVGASYVWNRGFAISQHESSLRYFWGGLNNTSFSISQKTAQGFYIPYLLIEY